MTERILINASMESTIFKYLFNHFLLQITIISYSMLSKRMHIVYEKNSKNEIIEEQKIKQRLESEKNNTVKNDLFGTSKLRRGNTLANTIKESELEGHYKKSTAEIILGFIICNWDIIIVIALYFAGAYQIDIYHI